MKIQSLHAKILKLGGSAEIKNRVVHGRSYPYLDGVLNGYDIHMSGTSGGEQSHFTVLAIRDRDQYDMGADYNPGGYMFMYRIKDLDEVKQWVCGSDDTPNPLEATSNE